MSKQDIEQDIRRIKAQIQQIVSRIDAEPNVSRAMMETWQSELRNLREALKWKQESLGSY